MTAMQASARGLRPVAATGTDPWWFDAALAAGMAGFAVLAVAAGQAGLARLGYPALALLIAWSLFFGGRRPAYIVFCLFLFVITPGVRRYVDLAAGWEQVNLVMLAPWLAAAPCLVVVLRTLTGPGFPMATGVLLVFVAACYGLGLAIIEGRAVSGAFDWLRWTVPPAFAAVTLLTLREDRALVGRLLRFFTLAVAVTGAYGAWQFVRLPPWDAFWMRNVDLASIGEPEPYQVRVFSLLNSPGSLGNFLLVGLIYLFAFASPARLPALAVGCAAMLLSLNRAAWGAAALAAAYLVLLGPGALKLRATLAIAGLAVALPVALQVPEAALAVQQRIESITYLFADTSYHERLDAYDAFLRSLGEAIMGQGLAINGAYRAYLDQRQAVFIDGQVIEAYLALGVVGGTVYFAAALACFGAGIAAGLRSRSMLGLASSAVALAAVMLLPYSSPLLGESGMFFWLGLALCFAPQPAREGRR